MKITDFVTLAEAKAYEYVEDKKRVGSGQARGYFVNNGIWKKLKLIQQDIEHDMFALADAIIVTASDASSYFGLDEDTAEGKANIAGAQLLVDNNIMTAEQKEEFLNKRYRVTRPFSNVTQDKFEAAKLQVNPSEVEVSYPSGDCIPKATTHIIKVTINTPFGHDDNLTMTAKSSPHENGDFVDYLGNRGFINVPANFTGSIKKKVNNADLDRFCKYYVASKFNRTFTCSVDTSS